MKLTPQQKEVFQDRLSWATYWDMATILWWGLVNYEKQRALIDWLMAGMSWKHAMRKARSNDQYPHDR